MTKGDFPFVFKPGPDLSPMDENGKLILDIVDLRQTWEVSDMNNT